MKNLITLGLTAIILFTGFQSVSQTKSKQQKAETKIEVKKDTTKVENGKQESRVSIKINKDGNETVIDTVISNVDQESIDAILSNLDKDSSMKEIKKNMVFSFDFDDTNLGKMDDIDTEIKKMDEEMRMAIVSPNQKDLRHPKEIRIERIEKPRGNMLWSEDSESLMLSYDKMNTRNLSAKEKKILNKAIYKYNKQVSQLVN